MELVFLVLACSAYSEVNFLLSEDYPFQTTNIYCTLIIHQTHCKTQSHHSPLLIPLQIITYTDFQTMLHFVFSGTTGTRHITVSIPQQSVTNIKYKMFSYKLETSRTISH